VIHNITYSFITVKTERSTLQYNLSRRTATIYMASAYAASIHTMSDINFKTFPGRPTHRLS